MYKFHPNRVANFQLDGLSSLASLSTLLPGKVAPKGPSMRTLEAESGFTGQYDVAGGVGNVAKGFAMGGPVGAGLAAVPEVFKLFQGLSQARKAKGLAQKRPEYQIPEAQQERMDMLRAGALDQRIPGQTLAQEQLGKTSQRNIEAIQQSGASPAEIIAGISNVGSQERGGLQQIGVQAGQIQEQRRQALVQGLGQQAEFQQAQQQYNVLDPFAENMQAKAALEEGSRQNIYGGIKGLSGVGIESLPSKSFGEGSLKKGNGSSYSIEDLAKIMEDIKGLKG